ncbi:hypothetical protein LguiB_014119 [Lonicera macranthoides]
MSYGRRREKGAAAEGEERLASEAPTRFTWNAELYLTWPRITRKNFTNPSFSSSILDETFHSVDINDDKFEELVELKFMKKQKSKGSVKGRALILKTKKVEFLASLFDKEVDGKKGWQKSHGLPTNIVAGIG